MKHGVGVRDFMTVLKLSYQMLCCNILHFVCCIEVVTYVDVYALAMRCNQWLN